MAHEKPRIRPWAEVRTTATTVEVKLIIPMPQMTDPEAKQHHLNDLFNALVGKCPMDCTRAMFQKALDHALIMWNIR